jgi:ORF6N domain
VLLGADMAAIHDVETEVLVKAVKRNAERFPADFMFQLSSVEVPCLRCQFGTSKDTRGGRRYAPHTFIELAVAMLSGALRSRMENV